MAVLPGLRQEGREIRCLPGGRGRLFALKGRNLNSPVLQRREPRPPNSPPALKGRHPRVGQSDEIWRLDGIERISNARPWLFPGH